MGIAPAVGDGMAGTVGLSTGGVMMAAAGHLASRPINVSRGPNENLRVVSTGAVGVGTTEGVGTEGAGAVSHTVTVTVVSPGQVAAAALTVPARSRVSKRILTE